MRILAIFILMIFTACRGVDAKTESRGANDVDEARARYKEQWARVFADLDRQFPTWDYTKDQSNICEVHHCVMEIEFVRVFRGLPMAMPRSIDSTVIAIGRKYQNQGVEAAPQLFELPHARHDITGCITGEVKDAKIYVCKMCNGDHK